MQARAGKSLAILVIVIAVAAAGAGAVLGPRLMAHPAAKGEKGAKTEKSEKAGGEQKGSSENPADDEKAKTEDAPIVELGEFLVNLEGASENHYLRAEVSIRVGGLPKAERKSEGGAASKNQLPGDDLAVAKDCVTTVLSGGAYSQLRTTAGREKLKKQTLAKLQEALTKYQIDDVLFTSFVMQ
jgi:flagellar basal body-associated protein FliL